MDWNKLSEKFFKPSSAAAIHRANIVLCVCMLAALLVVFYLAEIFTPAPPAIQSGEIDLSGTWKIQYSDSDKFADPKLDDSRWCWIGVPNTEIALKGESGDKPALDCPGEKYPKEKMLKNTYWYRKKIVIKEGQKWEEPSLFLGAVKQKAWVYWDGEYLGPAHRYLAPVILPLHTNHVRAGSHLIAVRVESEFGRYPGIFHAYPRNVTIGELKNGIAIKNHDIKNVYTIPAIAMAIQMAAFCILILLILKQKGINKRMFWLTLYFSSTSILPMKVFVDVYYVEYLLNVCLVGMGISLVGLSIENTYMKDTLKAILRRSILCYGALLVFINSYYFSQEQLTLNLVVKHLKTGLVLLPYPIYIYSILNWFGLFRAENIRNQEKISLIDVLSAVALLIMHSISTVQLLFIQDTALIKESPILTVILTLFVLLLAVFDYTEKVRSLAFYGRFVRPGLKRLLESNKKKDLGTEKFFRAKQTVILKIDIVDHTKNTYKMPYGLKRLYQDLWFSLVDETIADKIFLDKNLGDGSIYCFEDRKNICRTALESAMHITEVIVPIFDQQYKEKVRELIDVTPELQPVAEEFIARHPDFWHKRTKTRMALVSGCVDEGLWGLVEKSHYDVQGDLVSCVARIEANALSGEVLVSEEFFLQLKKEWDVWDTNYFAEMSILELKGIGQKLVYRMKKKRISLEKVAA